MHDPAVARRFWILAVLGGALVAIGLAAAHFMESHGHVVTGMNNQVVWGAPHVFAILLIVAASGVLNVASVGSVFGQTAYKPHAPLAGLLSMALLAGGLSVLVLDLGRPERLIVAATHYNLTSMFAWNVILYSGLAALIVVYLWTIAERRFGHLTKPVGIAVFVWRFVLTSGTGSIFGFLVARQAYASALLAPLFIVMSLGWGLAVFLIAQAGLAAWHGRAVDAATRQRMARLLGIFVAAGLYFVAVQHLTSLYFAKQTAFESFILLGRDGGGGFAMHFWVDYVLLGSLVPLGLLLHPKWASARATLIASALVLVGGFAWLWVFIIGGEAFPLEIFPGFVASSSFADGAVSDYAPSLPEALLGLGGVGIAFVATVVGVRVLDILPTDEASAAATAAPH